MKPREIETMSIPELVKTLLAYDSGWAFRGHSNSSWALSSTLERALGDGNWNPSLARACEKLALDKFGSRAHHYLSSDRLPDTTLGKLALLQHHGVPTRLLDFTTSPFVATFFAHQGMSPHQEQPCCIWAINFRAIMKRSISLINNSGHTQKIDYLMAMSQPDVIFDQVGSHHQAHCLWVTEPRMQSFRLERQKGTFLLALTLEKRIYDLILEDNEVGIVEKICIPANLRRAMAEMLTSIGLDNSRLFGDIDGFARDLHAEMSYHVETTIADSQDAGERQDF